MRDDASIVPVFAAKACYSENGENMRKNLSSFSRSMLSLDTAVKVIRSNHNLGKAASKSISDCF